MNDPFANEDDELQQLKNWWKNYGAAIVIGVVLGSALLGGYRYWSTYTDERAAMASMRYDEVVVSMNEGRVKDALKIGDEIKQEYAATPYGGMAALLMARMSFERGDLKATREHLRWAVDNAAEPITAHVARLRLARIMHTMGETKAALALIDIGDIGEISGFSVEYFELKGDLLLATGDRDGARKAYIEALVREDGGKFSFILKMKLADLGPGKSEQADAAGEKDK